MYLKIRCDIKFCKILKFWMQLNRAWLPGARCQRDINCYRLRATAPAQITSQTVGFLGWMLDMHGAVSGGLSCRKSCGELALEEAVGVGCSVTPWAAGPGWREVS